MRFPRSWNRLQHLVVIVIALLTPTFKSPALTPLGGAPTSPKIFDAPNQTLTMNVQPDHDSDAKAKNQPRSNNDIGAVNELPRLANHQRASSMAAAAGLESGKRYEDLGQLDAARLAYQAVMDQYPASAEAPDARFRLGFLAYRHGNFTAAATTWGTAERNGQFTSRLAFWLGKARHHLADDAGARAAWKSAVVLDPHGFYGLRANDLLHGRPAAVLDAPSFNLPLPKTTADDRRQLDAWYRMLGTDARTVRMAVQNDPGYRKVSQLVHHGDRPQASREIDGLVKRHVSDVAHLSALASLLADRGEVCFSAQVAQQAREAAMADSLKMPPALERLAHPIPYWHLILPIAKERGVDPLLFTALLRQESGFDPTARSSAGASGLAQIMPSTGEAIAEGLGRTHWKSEDLFKADVNIEFGLVYLADQLAAYQGQVFPALAAYNAGPGAVTDWMSELNDGDPDVFVERIPYPETREYVQRVYANYSQYERLYRDGSRS